MAKNHLSFWKTAVPNWEKKCLLHRSFCCPSKIKFSPDGKGNHRIGILQINTVLHRGELLPPYQRLDRPMSGWVCSWHNKGWFLEGIPLKKETLHSKHTRSKLHKKQTGYKCQLYSQLRNNGIIRAELKCCNPPFRNVVPKTGYKRMSIWSTSGLWVRVSESDLVLQPQKTNLGEQRAAHAMDTFLSQ